MMDINSLTAFIAVAESQSFSIAAEKLFLTQPAISKRIAGLEQSIGTRLFDRINRKVILTEAGQTLLPTARQVSQDLDRAKQNIAKLGDTISGKLSIGTSHHIGLHRLPNILREYKTLYPKVELDLHFMDSEVACVKVEDNKLELAIITLPEKQYPNLNTQVIWVDTMVIVAHHEHPLMKIKQPMMKDLALHPTIAPSPDTVTRQVLDKALLPYGVSLNVGMETNYIETIKMMASVGLGWSAIPASMIDQDICVIPVNDFNVSRNLGVVNLKGRSLSTAAKAFITLLESQIKPTKNASKH